MTARDEARKLMDEALDRPFTFDLLRDPEWQPTREHYAALKETAEARVVQLEAALRETRILRDAAVDERKAVETSLGAALSWALDSLELALERIDFLDTRMGEKMTPEHYRISAAGLAKARAALSGLGDA